MIADALLFEIELITDEGLELASDAMFDTDFSYLLAINDRAIDALDWEYLQEQTIERSCL